MIRLSQTEYILGVDIGGTKLAAGVVNAVSGDAVKIIQAPTLAHEGPEKVISRLVALCHQAITAANMSPTNLAGVGISCAGPLDWQAGIVRESPNLPGWIDIPLTGEISASLGIPAFLENDANAAAVGEHRFGAGRGTRNMVYITVSTGIGGGAIINGELYHGENGYATEVGHMVIKLDGRPCTCGKQGCLEAYASGTALALQAQQLVGSGAGEKLRQLAGKMEHITAQTVVTAVRDGNQEAIMLWQEAMTALGAGIANVINCFNPRLVVIGGGMSKAGDMLFTPVRKAAKQRAMNSIAAVVDIVPAQLGSAVGVIGAAAIALQRQAKL